MHVSMTRKSVWVKVPRHWDQIPAAAICKISLKLLVQLANQPALAMVLEMTFWSVQMTPGLFPGALTILAVNEGQEE